MVMRRQGKSRPAARVRPGRAASSPPVAVARRQAPSVQPRLDAAIQAHRSGRLAEAEALYRQVLAADPSNAAALHLFGMLASQLHQPEAAVALIERAIEIDAA